MNEQVIEGRMTEEQTISHQFHRMIFGINVDVFRITTQKWEQNGLAG